MLFSYKILTGAKELKTGTVFCEVQIFVASYSSADEYQKNLDIEKEEYSEYGYSIEIFDNHERQPGDGFEALTGECLKPYIHDLGIVFDTDLGIAPLLDNEISSTCFAIGTEEAYHAMGLTFGSHEAHKIQVFANPNRYFANLT